MAIERFEEKIMPKGKGTYGSQVGRPSKMKYEYGGNVDPFSTRNPEGVPAEQLNEAMENQNMANEGLPTSNAMERSQMSPDTEQYEEGGKVEYAKGGRLLSSAARLKMRADAAKSYQKLEEDWAQHKKTMQEKVKKKKAKSAGVRAGVQKSPKYKGAPVSPKERKP